MVVRKYLSRIKGGKLAAASYPAHVVTLVISDVPGDDPAIIASGPTIFDTSTAQDALTILRRYEIAIGDAVLRSLSSLSKVRQIHAPDVRMIATPNLMLKAAADFARRHNITSLILGDALEGEARDVGKALSGIARSARSHGLPAQPPCVLLSGGETTVSIRHNTPGRGGRNCEFLLSAGIALEGEANIWGLAGDTDGIDGTEDAAGAILAPDSLSRARAAGPTRLFGAT